MDGHSWLNCVRRYAFDRPLQAHITTLLYPHTGTKGCPKAPKNIARSLSPGSGCASCCRQTTSIISNAWLTVPNSLLGSSFSTISRTRSC